MPNNLTISEPWNYCTYQRDNSNRAFIPLAGTATAGATVTATFTPVAGLGQTVGITTQKLTAGSDGTYSGRAIVPGGWYTFEVVSNGETQTKNRVGSGEVFPLWGHSFISGGHDLTHQLPASDERVCALLDNVDTTAYQFSQLNQIIGPMHTHADGWGQLGDKLVKRLGVPVMFYGCGYGGSNILQNYQVLKGLDRSSMPPGLEDKSSRQPLLPLERVMELYVTRTGARCILVEHGYNDTNATADDWAMMFQEVVSYVRTKWNKPHLAIMLVQEQLQRYANRGYYTAGAASGIQKVLATYPDTYKGPDFNNTQWLTRFQTSEHLYGTDIDQYATEWSDSISADFLAKSSPYLSEAGANALAGLDNNGTFSIAGITLKTLDWVILIAAMAFLLLYYFKHKKYLLIGALLLAAFGVGRYTNK